MRSTKPQRRARATSVAAAFIGFLGVSTAMAQPGAVDLGFNPDANNHVYGTAMQPDGKIVIVGSFTTVGGVGRKRIARLNADGTLDAAFDPGANGTVYSAAIQVDGKIVIGGSFEEVGGLSRNHAARLNADGAVDIDFNPSTDQLVWGTAVQGDGKILLTGQFFFVNGQARRDVARLNSDGTLDTGFLFEKTAIFWNSGPFVFSAVEQADGRILLGYGDAVGWAPSGGVVRVLPDGSVDQTFIWWPGGNSSVFSIAVQRNGQILLGGLFTTMGGQIRRRIARLNADGQLDAGFNPDANEAVHSIAVQTDGRILIGGYFTTVGGLSRNRVARLHPNGFLDVDFDPNVAGVAIVDSVAVHPNGIVVGGAFSTVGGVTRNNIVRLENDPATQSLTIPNRNRIEWLRGGASPETQLVTFDLSTDGGTVYNPLGKGARIDGGWQLTGLSLPADGRIRARARTAGGQYNGSSGLLQAELSYTGLPAPEIAVAGNGVQIADGDTAPSSADHTHFGSADVFAGMVARTFTITNSGNADLFIGPFNFGGPQAADFSVSSAPASVVGPGGSTTFEVTFDPRAAGVRNATLNVANNDYDETPFNFSIEGAGVTSPAAGSARAIGINSTARHALSAAQTEVWYRVRLFAHRSYQFSAWTLNEDGTPGVTPVSVALFSYATGSPASPAPATLSAPLEGSPNDANMLGQTALFQPTDPGLYAIRVAGQPAVTDTSINLAVRETTLFSPWTSRAAGFEGFVEMHNNTDTPVSITLLALSSAGTLQGTGLTFTLPANATDFRTATEVGVPVGGFAGIVLTHGGAFGAVSANVTTLNGASGLSFDSPFTPRDSSIQASPVR